MNLLKNIYIRNLLGIIVVAGLLVYLVFFQLKRYTKHGVAVEIPDVKGLSVEKAEPFFTDKKLKFLVVDSAFVRGAVPGSIAETTPPVGSTVKEGRTVFLKINAYLPNMLTIPDVKDASQRHARAMLTSMGFENVSVKMVSGTYRDLVVGLESRGTPVEAGQRLTADAPLSILVSSGSDDILLFEDMLESDSTAVSIDELSF